MKQMFLGLRPVVALAALGFLLPAEGFSKTTTEDVLKQSFQAEPGGQFTLESDGGSVDVVTGDKPQVEIEVRRKVTGLAEDKARPLLQEHEVTFDQDGPTLRVKGRLKPTHSHLLRQAGFQVQYTISLPRQFNLELRTAGGHIKVGDVQGEVKARTAAGSLTFAAISGPLTAETSGGSIELAQAISARLKTSGGHIHAGEVEGELHASTAGGSIKLRKAGGPVTARTSAGSIELGEVMADVDVSTHGGSITISNAGARVRAYTTAGNLHLHALAGPLEATTHGGSITATLRESPREKCSLQTSAGNITLSLPEQAALDLDARATAGRIKCDLPVTVQGEWKRDVLAGKVKGGGAPIVIRTHGGNITLKTRQP
jgi:DUF4097 and DUF4098 domain-containing protein YvlB